MVVNRSLRNQGFGYLLYWFHDHVFLTVKGYLFTLYLPWSLMGWGVAATFFILYLTAWLGRISFIAEPHLQLARFAVSRTGLHPFLVASSKWLRRLTRSDRTVPYPLLDEVIGCFRERAMLRLWTCSQPDQTAIEDAFRFSRLHLRFLTMAGVGRPGRVRALSVFHSVLSRFHYIRGGNAERIAAMVHTLFQETKPVIPAMANTWKDAGKPSVDQLFSLESLAEDCCRLACLFDPRIRASLPQAFGPDRARPLTRTVPDRLASVARARLAVLRRLYEFFERRTLFPENLETIASPPFEKSNRDPEEAALAGSLALGLALDASRLTSNPELALTFLEAVESLRLAIQLNGEALTIHEEIWIRNISNLIRDIPLPHHYRACAELAQVDVRQRERVWRESVLYGAKVDDGPIQKTDFALERTRVRSLFRAAGPGLDKDAGHLPYPEPR